MEVARRHWFPLCSPPLSISRAPGHTGNICFPSHSSCSLCGAAGSVPGITFLSQQSWEVDVSIPALQIRTLRRRQARGMDYPRPQSQWIERAGFGPRSSDASNP